MWKGWLCVPAIYSKGKHLYSILAVSVIVWGSLLGNLAFKFAVALIPADLCIPKKQNVKKDTSNKHEKFDEQ